MTDGETEVHKLEVPGFVARQIKNMLMPPGAWGRVSIPKIKCRLLDHYTILSTGETDVSPNGVMFIFGPKKETRATHIRLETTLGHTWQFPIRAGAGVDVRKKQTVSFWFPFQDVDFPARG